MGWIPGTVTRKFDMIRLWNRFINMSNDRINYKVFLWSKVQNSPWAAEIHAEEAEFLEIIYHAA